MKITLGQIRFTGAVIFLLFAINQTYAQKEKRPTILFTPQWNVNTTVAYQTDFQRMFRSNDFSWSGQYSDIEKLTVIAKTDSSFTLQWDATGYPVNIFQDFPGPMVDWFQEWNKGKEVKLLIRFSNLGVPASIVNIATIRAYYISMIDEFLNALPTRNVAPLNKTNVKKSLENLRTVIIPSDVFPKIFLNNLNMLFPFYGKTFFQDQDQKITQYKTLPTMSFAVPIETRTVLEQGAKDTYHLFSTQRPLPFDKWRIKPNGYMNIDFAYTDSVDFRYNTQSQWVTQAIHTMKFERNNYSDNFSITYTKVK